MNDELNEMIGRLIDERKAVDASRAQIVDAAVRLLRHARASVLAAEEILTGLTGMTREGREA